MTDARATLAADFAAIVAYLPHALAGLVILVAGSLAAWVLGSACRALSARLGIDRFGGRNSVADDLQAIGLQTPLSRVIGRLVFAVVFIATLVQTMDALQLAPLSDALRLLLGYMPRLIIAGAIIVFGAFIGDALALAAATAARRAGVLYDAVIGTLVRGLILILAGLMALQQLTVDATFLLDVLIVGLGGVVLALALAVGLGARSFVENVAAARYAQEIFAVGEPIDVGDFAGTVEHVDMTSTTIRRSDGRLAIIPNAYFVARVVTKGEVESSDVTDSPRRASSTENHPPNH